MPKTSTKEVKGLVNENLSKLNCYDCDINWVITDMYNIMIEINC